MIDFSLYSYGDYDNVRTLFVSGFRLCAFDVV